MNSISNLLVNGYANIQKEYQAREIEKVDYYRAGSAGCYVDEKFYGNCPRKVVHRKHLIQAPANFELHMIFTAGFAHEANLINLLLNSDEVELIEVWDIPSYFLPNHPKLKFNNESLIITIPGTDIKLSGRPDIVVTLKGGYRFGIEAKANTTEGKAMGASVSPYISALCQSALYRDILQIDYNIVYGCAATFGKFYLQFEVAKGKCPSEKEYPRMEYRKFPSGVYFRVPPSMYSYAIATDKTGVIYTEDQTGEFIPSPCTIQGVYDYYKVIDKCIKDEVLPDRPTDFELNGEVKYSSCKYCEYKDACDNYDNRTTDYKGYLKEVTSLVDIKKEELAIS